MKVYFSTVRRYSEIDKGGEVVKLDWDTKTVEQRRVINVDNFPVVDPNPRGNSRGGRGIAQIGDTLAVASYHTLWLFDQDLNVLDEVTHPLMVGLHEVAAAPDGRVWVASTTIDAVLLIDLQSKRDLCQYWARELTPLQQAWNLEPMDVDKTADLRVKLVGMDLVHSKGHMHINAVCPWRGQMYAFANRFGAVVNLDTGQIMFQSPLVVKGHNLVINEEGLAFINDTIDQHLCVFELATGKLVRRIDLIPFHWAGNTARWYKATLPVRKFLDRAKIVKMQQTRPMFVRGLDVTGDLAYIGLSPASILCVNWRTGRLINSYTYSRDVSDAVHGLRVVP